MAEISFCVSVKSHIKGGLSGARGGEMNTELLICEVELHSIQKIEADLMSAGCERLNLTHLRSSETHTLRDQESYNDKCTCGSFPFGCNDVAAVCFRKKQQTVRRRGFYRNAAGCMKGFTASEMCVRCVPSLSKPKQIRFNLKEIQICPENAVI